MGIVSDQFDMSLVKFPHIILQTPKVRNPKDAIMRVSTRATNNPTSGMAKIAPIPRGATAKPELKASYDNIF